MNHAKWGLDGEECVWWSWSSTSLFSTTECVHIINPAIPDLIINMVIVTIIMRTQANHGQDEEWVVVVISKMRSINHSHCQCSRVLGNNAPHLQIAACTLQISCRHGRWRRWPKIHASNYKSWWFVIWGMMEASTTGGDAGPGWPLKLFWTYNICEKFCWWCEGHCNLGLCGVLLCFFVFLFDSIFDVSFVANNRVLQIICGFYGSERWHKMSWWLWHVLCGI